MFLEGTRKYADAFTLLEKQIASKLPRKMRHFIWKHALAYHENFHLLTIDAKPDGLSFFQAWIFVYDAVKNISASHAHVKTDNYSSSLTSFRSNPSSSPLSMWTFLTRRTIRFEIVLCTYRCCIFSYLLLPGIITNAFVYLKVCMPGWTYSIQRIDCSGPCSLRAWLELQHVYSIRTFPASNARVFKCRRKGK